MFKMHTFFLDISYLAAAVNESLDHPAHNLVQGCTNHRQQVIRVTVYYSGT
jgi:hypothetical protein